VPDPKLAESLAVPPAVTLVADEVVVSVGLFFVTVRLNGVVVEEAECVESPPKLAEID
jgi:hypothetical protein